MEFCCLPDLGQVLVDVLGAIMLRAPLSQVTLIWPDSEVEAHL